MNRRTVSRGGDGGHGMAAAGHRREDASDRHLAVPVAVAATAAVAAAQRVAASANLVVRRQTAEASGGGSDGLGGFG